MFDQPDLKLHGICYVNGRPLVCGHCGTGTALEVTKRGWRESWPAFVSCLSCGQGEDHDVLTNGLVDAAKEASTGRRRAEDRDTFRAEWRGVLFVGEQVPQIVLDDVVQGGKALADELRRQAREKKAEASGRARSWWGGKKKAARQAAQDKAAGVTAAALGAAWQLQTGGAGPAPKPKARRCAVQGCRGGMVTITTRVHGQQSGRSSTQKVPCGVCARRAGS
ncbi:hypothetical protein ABZ569_33530 [Streptomyces albus]|uniref:hypothetical protein n=1 Tax=Streptomyces albus TaxID=1888 RepID=UPI0034026FBB